MSSLLRLLTFVLCALLAGCGKHESPQEAASKFFALCAEGKFSEAYQSAAARFRLERSPKFFETRAREIGLDRDHHPTWGDPEKKGQTLVLPGTFKSPAPDGKTTIDSQFSIVMVDEDGWRVLEVKRPPEGPLKNEDLFQVKTAADGGSMEGRSFFEAVQMSMPSDEQLRKLAETTIMNFDACVKAGDFKPFYDYVSDRWKYRGADPNQVLTRRLSVNSSELDVNNVENRLTITTFTERFHRFIDLKVDMSDLKGKKLLLDTPPLITTAGVLTLVGTFDGYVFVTIADKPPLAKKLHFRLEYVMEANNWRVYGLSLEVPD